MKAYKFKSESKQEKEKYLEELAIPRTFTLRKRLYPDIFNNTHFCVQFVTT